MRPSQVQATERIDKNGELTGIGTGRGFVVALWSMGPGPFLQCLHQSGPITDNTEAQPGHAHGLGSTYHAGTLYVLIACIEPAIQTPF